MIPIPTTTKVSRDKRAEKWLLDKARTWLTSEERAAGLHASDLLDLRRAFWRAVDPQPMSDRDVGMFLPGKILHAFVLGSAADRSPDIAKSDEGSSYSDEFGIWYSIDWDKSDIAEFKTSRAFKAPESIGDLDIYIEQVLVYLACKNRTSAKLWVLYLNLRDEVTRKTAPTFKCFDITITEAELEEVKAFIRASKVDYERARSTGDWRHLDLCREWLCGPSMCPWWNKCKPEGRYGEQEWSK